MILDFTDEEIKALDALEESGKKLLDDLDKEIEKLSPYDPKQYEEEEDKLYQSLPIRPQEPEPIGEDENGTPIYRESDMIAYHNSPEYIAYTEENRRIMEAISAHHKAFFDAGSEEFHEAIRRYRKLEDDLAQSRYEFYKKVEDKHFSELENDPRKILEDAFSQVERLIMNRYNYYCDKRKKSDYSTIYVRLQDDDSIKLDTGAMRKYILEQLERHIEALPEEAREELYTFVDSALATNPYVGDTGKKGVWVRRKETTEERGLTARPLDKRTVIITRLMDIVFNGKKTLERSYEKDFNDPTNRYDLGLYSTDSPYKLKVALDYNAIVDNEIIKLPALTRMAKHIYNAIVSYWLQGNYKPTYRQIWRAACGNMKRRITYERDEKLQLEKALLSFKANIAFSTGEIVEISKADNKVSKVKEAGGAYQLLHYDTQYLKVNGQQTDVLLLDPNRRPVLLEIAQALNNEYMTDNIDFFDVKGLANTEENLDLKDYIFIRIKKMKNPNNGVKQKKISLDTLVDDLGIKPFDKTDAKDRVRKSRLVDRIVKILDNAVSVNFIEGYTVNKRKGSTEVISFSIDLYKKRAIQ